MFSLTSIRGKFLATATGLAVFAYLIYRATHVPFCNDEAVSFFTYISDGLFIPFYNAQDFSANNHVLNSLLSWLAYKSFGVHAFVLRLPNLLAFVLYAFYAFKCAQLFQAKLLQWFAFLALILSSYYFLEFFSLSRGYGLSYAFFIASFYHVTRAYSFDKVYRNLLISLLFIALATLANLGFLISYCIWWLFSAPLFLRQKRNVKNVLFVLLLGIPLAFFVSLSLRIKEAGELYHGQDTLYTSLWTVMTRLLPITTELQFYIANAFVLIVLAASILIVVKKGVFKIDNIHMALGFLLGNLLGAFVLNLLLNVPFPSSRTALHWFLYFLILLPFVLNGLKGIVKKVFFGMAIIFLAATQINSVANMGKNISAEYYWNMDEIPDSFYAKILRLQGEGNHQLSIATQRTYTTNTLAFLNAAHPSSTISLGKEFKTNPKMNADVCIADVHEFPELLTAYETLEFDTLSGLSLLKRSEFLERNIFSTSEKSLVYINDEFVSLSSNSISNIEKKALQLDFDLRVCGKNEAYQGLIFISVDDSLGKQVYYEQFRTWFFLADKKGNRHVNFNVIIDELPKTAAVVNVMLWNINQQEIDKIESKVALIQLLEPNEISIFEQ